MGMAGAPLIRSSIASLLLIASVGAKPALAQEVQLLIIRADTSDNPGQPISEATARSQAEFARDFYDAQSYGKVKFPKIDITPLVRLSKTVAYYDDGTFPLKIFELSQDGKAA